MLWRRSIIRNTSEFDAIFFHKAKSLNNLFNLFGFLIMIHMKAGDVNYENKEDCDWIIEARPGRNVHLR